MSLSETIHTLVVSSNRGRYACDDSEHGHDLTSGEACAILLGNRWIDGRIEHGSQIYATGQSVRSGYYFISTSGDISGLCVGAKVRLYERS